MGIRLKFVQDDSMTDIEIIIRAKEQDDTVRELLEKLGTEGDLLPCSVLSDEKLIDTKDIVIISKTGRFLSVKTTNGEYILRDPLYRIEEKLDPDWFVKISQSEIVNLRFVRKWTFEGGGVIRIELENGISSYTSRRYAVQIRKILTQRGDI